MPWIVGHAKPERNETGPGHKLLHVGITDQGTVANPEQLRDLVDELGGAGNNATVVIYVHGWQNGAASADVDKFRRSLEQTLHADVGLSGLPERGRQIIGIYLSWNGRTFGGPFKLFSFWDRQHILSNAAQGGVREVLELLRVWRYQPGRVSAERGTSDRQGRRLIVIGHSFGGAIVFRALAQSLFGIVADGAPLRTPADCVLLVNPALSAASYLPLHEAAARGPTTMAVPGQGGYPFKFIAVTASNDRSVGTHFPVSQFRRLYLEKTKGRNEEEALLKGMGFLPLFQTGRLVAENGRAVIVRLPGGANSHPLLEVLTATPDVIDDHGGIGKAIFVDWVRRTVTEPVGAC